jgi:hypothetical protein
MWLDLVLSMMMIAYHMVAAQKKINTLSFMCAGAGAAGANRKKEGRKSL